MTTAAVFAAFFAIVAAAQLRAHRFHPALYWSVVLGTSMLGTEISDFLNRGNRPRSAPNALGYVWGAVLLTVVFLIWWRTGQTYDVENISSHTGEVLYWTAILVEHPGHSSGDWLAEVDPPSPYDTRKGVTVRSSTRFVNLEEVDEDQIKQRASILETVESGEPAGDFTA